MRITRIGSSLPLTLDGLPMSYSRENDPFAVSTPVPTPGGANLSPQERQVYEFLWKHRERAPSFAELLARNAPRWILVAFTIVVTTAVLFTIDALFDSPTGASEFDVRPYYVVGGLGVLFGIMLRDYGYCKNVKKLWPLEAAVIDFAKVERLLWGEPAPVAIEDGVRSDEPLAAIPVEAPGPAGLLREERR